MKKKFLPLALALFMSLLLLPAYAASAGEDDLLYQPNPICGECLGKNADGAYEFNITIPNDRENQPFPLLTGSFYETHEITNTGASAGSTQNIIYTRAQYFYGCNPGTADITYSVYRDSEWPPRPMAIVHVTVLSQADYDAYMDSPSTPAGQGHTHRWYYKWTSPTCEYGGQFYRECNGCHTKEMLKTCPATEHRYISTITRQPTAQWEGSREYRCVECHKKYTESIPKQGGSKGDQTNAGQPGTGTATQPGASTPDDVCINGNMHQWVEKETAATAMAEGQIYRICTVCGKRETIRVLPKLENSAKPGSGKLDTNTPGASASQPAADSHVTGSLDMPQLSKQEIIDLLEANPASFSGQLYDSQPSCSASYAAGKLSSAALQAALNRLNALRRIVGMPATQLDQSWCESAQYGAVILGKMGTLSHTPSKPADMSKDFYDKAYAATYSSNLSAGSDLVASVDSLMRDYTAKNITSTGHRRWQLSPALNKVGFGYVDNGAGYGKFTDVKVFDRDEGFSAAHSVNYDSFGWPSAGYFPNDMAGFTANCPWTVSLNPDIYAVPGGITVRISGGGKNWTLSGSYTPSDAGAYLGVTPADDWNYGGNHCIAFRPDGVDKYEGVYTVEIQGLKSRKDNSAIPFTYQVEFFSMSQPAASGTGETPSASNKPSDPTAPAKPAKPTTSGGNPFTDVPTGMYYTDAVLWAYQNKITSGTTATTFEPSAACTRGQVVTFLWRSKGEPEPKTTVNPFRDVKTSDYYCKAVLWAYENGITSGTTATAFSPNDTCTNGHVITFLWRANGEPSSVGTSSLAGQFARDYYTDAVAWADTTGLLKDTGSAFNPKSMSPRANIVTYLYRDLAGAVSTADASKPGSTSNTSATDFSREYMSSKYYRQLQEVVLTGNYREDLLAVAASQIGYTEGSKEEQIDGSGGGRGDYTEYGRYMGSNGSAWCSEFASWCARMAGIPSDILHSSRSASVETFAVPYYTWSETVFAGGSYTPRPGDLALFAWNGTSPTAEYLSHTSIVKEVAISGDTVTVTVIDGNSNSSVCQHSYTMRTSDGYTGRGYLVYFVAPNYD